MDAKKQCVEGALANVTVAVQWFARIVIGFVINVNHRTTAVISVEIGVIAKNVVTYYAQTVQNGVNAAGTRIAIVVSNITKWTLHFGGDVPCGL